MSSVSTVPPNVHKVESIIPIFDSIKTHFLDLFAGCWEAWNSMITNYVYPETSTPDYSQIMVPIVDNIRIDYLVACVCKQEISVLLIGEQGVGKTVMIKSYMKKANPEHHLSRSFNFSSATTPYQFQVGTYL